MKHEPRRALVAAGCYAVAASAYIVASDEFLTSTAESLADSRMIEILKGLAFVVVTSVALYFILTRHETRLLARARDVAQRDLAIARSAAQAAGGSLAAGASHDLRNLLMIAGGSAELMGASPTLAPELRPLIEQIRIAVERGAAITHTLASAARPFTSKADEPVDAYELVAETVRLARMHESSKDRTFDVNSAAGVVATMNRGAMQQALLNLIINAAQAARSCVRVTVRRRGHGIAFEVHDDGPGVAEELRGRIFDCAKSTKATGTGLGLLSARTCVELHGGAISAGSSPLGGALFTVFLPLEESLDAARVAHVA